jgi:phytoene dehydrogenase-like protein
MISMIVVGGGIGGLLVAALYPNTTLFEKMSSLGGRFRNMTYRGFQLTTGALHMVPHGSKGPLALLLQEVGADCTIIDASPIATFYYDKEFRFRQVLNRAGAAEKMRLYTMLLEMKIRKGGNQSFQKYLEKRTKNEIILKGFRSFCIWALSVEPDEVSSHEMFSIIKSLFKYKGPGTPMGGCSGIISVLKDAIVRRGNTIIHKKVTEISADEKVYGVIDKDGKEYSDSIVVSDIGAKATSQLVRFPKEYQKKIDALTPSEGIKYSLASKESLVWHNGVMLTPGLEYIGGVNQPTNADSRLAPKGYHLAMAHRKIASSNYKKEKEKGLEELEILFKGRNYEVLSVQIYRHNNPVNHAASGHDLDQETPIKGLYLVGDSAKGEGGIEVEGIALGVERLRRLLQAPLIRSGT